MSRNNEEIRDDKVGVENFKEIFLQIESALDFVLAEAGAAYSPDRETHQVGERIVAATRSASESVESASLALESIDDIEGGDCLPLGMLTVGD